MIIRANDTDYQVTSHAEERMIEYRIKESDIIHVIENAEMDFTLDGNEIYIDSVRGRRIAIVIVDDDDGSTPRIKTAYVVE